MDRPIVYLAGPMNGLTWDQCFKWRKETKRFLNLKGLDSIIPGGGEVEYDWPENKKEGSRNSKNLHISNTASGFTTMDEYYIRISDLVLVNFEGASKVSSGTIWEMGFAHALNKTIVTVVEPETIHDSGFVRRKSDIFVPTLQEALEFLECLAKPLRFP